MMKGKVTKEEQDDQVAVCVTGASGFIASHLVKLLLLRGYTVHATVRDPDNGEHIEHLQRLEGAKERLHIFKAELMEEGSFDAAIVGCQGVFHTASPVNFNVTDPEAEVLDPAVKGTLNVLRACSRIPSVRRFIYTSSMATVLFTGTPLTPNVVVDESWFSVPEHCNLYPSAKWYNISKVLAESAGRKFCEDNGIDMVVMNPGTVMGPMLQPTLNETNAIIWNLINGAETYPNMVLPIVHVENIVEAHIRAFEIPSTHGRYILGGTVVHCSEIVKQLRELYPSLQLPNKCADDGVLIAKYQVSNTKAKSLGIDFIPVEKTLKDAVESLKEKKFFIAFRA